MPISAPHHFKNWLIDCRLSLHESCHDGLSRSERRQKSSSPRNRTSSNCFEDSRANPSHSQAESSSVSTPGIEPDLRPSQSRVRIQYTSRTITQWCRWDSNPQTLVSKTSRSAVGVPHRHRNLCCSQFRVPNSELRKRPIPDLNR